MIKQQIISVAEKIKSYPFVDRIEVRFGDKTPESHFSEAKALLGFPLNLNIKRLYSECNGMELYVEYNQDFYQQHKIEINEKVKDPFFILPEDEENKYLGLHFLPFEEIFLKQWFNFKSDENKDFNGKKYTLSELAKSIKPFDLFSGYTCAAFYVNAYEKDCSVILLDEHYDNWSNSALISFDSYLQIIIKSFFSVAARKDIIFRQASVIDDTNLIKDKINRLTRPMLFMLD